MLSTRKINAGLFVVLALFGTSSAFGLAASRRASLPTLFGEVSDGQVAANSAVSATSFALLYLHQPVHLRQLAHRLGVGRTWQRPADMRAIENVLVRRRLGVRSSAGEDVTFNKIAARLARGHGRDVAIISLDGLHVAGAGRRYYAVLAGRTPAKLYVAAIGMYTGVQSVKFMNQHLGQYLGHALKVFVTGYSSSTRPQAARLTWYPEAINLGNRWRAGRLGGQAFTVLVPRGITLGRPAVSCRLISVIGLQDSAGLAQRGRAGRNVHRYVVDLSRLAAGPVDAKIVIHTTDKHVPVITIPITGEVRR